MEAQWNFALLGAKDDRDPQLVKARDESSTAIQSFASKWQADPSYTTKPSQLKQALDEYEKLLRDFGFNATEWYYFHLRSAQDQLSSELKAQSRTADEIATKLYNTLQFFALNIAKIPPADQPTFLKYAPLQPYHHFISRLFQEQKFLLSEPEEKILNLMSQPGRDSWVNMTSTFLSQEQLTALQEDGTSTQKSLTEVLSLTTSTQKDVRDSAAEQVHTVMRKYAATATEELNAILQYKKITDELRGFERPDQSRHISDDIDSTVVDALLKAVSDRFDISAEFYKFKAKLFHQDVLAYHERNVPYGNLDQHYSFEQASELVHRTLQHLDAEFGQIYTDFLNNGQFDVYPRNGKVGGAFCAHNLITQPTYILLNHTEKLSDVLTLAHEMGHGIHNELARQKQNALNFGTSLATAEVSSTFMEDFVLEQLLQQADKQTQLAVMMMKLNDDISSIFRQVACYQFEQELHTEFRHHGYLSTEQIGQIFQKHMRNYMGDGVEQSAGSENWWVYWSHIRNYFYVYSYASGLLISKSLQAMVRANAQDIQKVKQFMAAGESASPIEIFQQIGVDITQQDFWQLGLEEISHLLQHSQQLAEELKAV